MTARTGSIALFTALGARTDIDAAAKQAFGSDVPSLWGKWVESLGT